MPSTVTSQPIAVDLIVIGSGIYGIQAARTHLEVHPTSNVAILESSDSPGGVWSCDRVYSDFWTQTPLGFAEFSDRPFPDVLEDEQYYGFFPAKYVSAYLKSYLDNHLYSGTTLSQRIRYNCAVRQLRKIGEHWHAICADEEIEYKSTKVIDATGLSSVPNMPAIPCLDTYKGHILHQKQFAEFERSHIGLHDSAIKHVIVIGGAKSAADIAYTSAKAGKEVTWVIRRSGAGPAAFAPAKGQAGCRNSNECFYTRLTSQFLCSWFSTTSFSGKPALIGKLINSTWLGRQAIQYFWSWVNKRIRSEARYDRADGLQTGFPQLKPESNIFWQNDSSGINQRPDFFRTIATGVTVLREDILRAHDDGLVLADDKQTFLGADAIICATGWQPSHPHFTDDLASTLGLPVDANKSLSEDSRSWVHLLSQADRKICDQMPLLNGTWQKQHRGAHCGAPPSTPFRLFRGILPLEDPSILFLGKVMLGNHFRAAEVQAVWACAMFDGYLKLPSRSEMEQDIASTVAWCRRRYPVKGILGNWFYWDLIPYTDTLLRDVGLSSHLLESTLSNLVKPCVARQLKDLIQEYRQKQQ